MRIAIILVLGLALPALAADQPTPARRREFAAKLEKSVQEQGVKMRVTTMGAEARSLLVKTGSEECTEDFAKALLRQIGAAGLRALGFEDIGCVDNGEHSEWATVPQR